MKIEDTVFVYRLTHADRLSSADRLSWHGRYHAHEATEFEIHFFLEGSGSFLCNQTRYPISGGRLFLTGPREFHSIIPEAVAAPLTYYAVLFSLEPPAAASLALASENIARYGEPTVQPPSEDEKLLDALRATLAARQVSLAIDPNFRFQFEDLLQMAKSADPALRESAVHVLASFLYRWFCRRSTPNQSAAATGGEGKINRVHVEKALAFMRKSVRENALVEDFSRKLGLSPEHFIRIFRDEVHMTPHQYFIRLKVEGASGLLISTDRTVGEISDWFGFENQFHFSRVFRKCTGLSPLEYRKAYIQTVDFS